MFQLRTLTLCLEADKKETYTMEYYRYPSSWSIVPITTDVPLLESQWSLLATACWRTCSSKSEEPYDAPVLKSLHRGLTNPAWLFLFCYSTKLSELCLAWFQNLPFSFEESLPDQPHHSISWTPSL